MNLPVGPWPRAFLALSLLYVVTSTFTLAKCVRDHQESTAVVSRVDQWDTTELTRELERNIGRDLQFVRINGTLVGGLIGLLIHAITVWARG